MTTKSQSKVADQLPDKTAVKINCSFSHIDQQKDYFEFMNKLLKWSILNVRTGHIENKGLILAKYYHSDPEVLRLMMRPITEEWDTLVNGYKLIPRKVENWVEDEMIQERVQDCIKKYAIKYLLSCKTKSKCGVIKISYDELLEKLTDFGKKHIFDKHDKINDDVEKSFG